MDKRYTVVYISNDLLDPTKKEIFSNREECVKFILDHVYDIVTVKFGNHDVSIGGLLCWMGDLISFRC